MKIIYNISGLGADEKAFLLTYSKQG